MTVERSTAGLKRAMGLGDVVMFLVVAVIGLRWIATAAAIGPSSLVIWLIGFVAMFVPLAAAVVELSSRHPDEGGIYVWTKRAFGEFAGFMTGWMYWTSNLVYFPGLLYFTAGNALFVGPSHWLTLSNSAPYFIIASLVGLAVALALNLLGLSVGKWLHNAGAVGTWLPIAILVAMGGVALARFGSATRFAPGTLAPGASLKDIALWSTIAFAFSGLEAASFMGEEIVDARRNIPRAILLGGISITTIYVLGTLAILVALPGRETSGLAGIMQAISRTGERVGFPGVTPLAAALITVGSVGGVGAWLASTARLPFVVGIDRYLPPAFARVHPRFGTPYVALLVQAAGAALFAVLGQAGTDVRGAYDALTSMAVIASFVPYLIMFAAWIRLQRQPVGPDVTRIPGGVPVAIAVASLGFATTLVSIVLALLPPEGSKNPALAVFKVVGLSALLIAIGLVLYARGRRRALSRTIGDVS